jgi:hypothetical protein
MLMGMQMSTVMMVQVRSDLGGLNHSSSHLPQRVINMMKDELPIQLTFQLDKGDLIGQWVDHVHPSIDWMGGASD